VVKRTLERTELLSFFAQLESSLVGMEAGSGAHHWARELLELGHSLNTANPCAKY
jgi:transposase